MNYFWGGVAALVVLALALLAFENGAYLGPIGVGDQPVVYDLETECRAEGSNSQVSLRNDRILLEGFFPYRTNNADLDYRYSQNSNSIRLDVRASGASEENDTFLDDCLGQVRYRMESRALESGSYSVKVLHNGEMARNTRISVP